MCEEQRHSKIEVLPPWIAFPDYSPGDLGFRMGGGEDFIERWREFLAGLSTQAKEEFKQKYPAPEGWEVYYEIML